MHRAGLPLPLALFPPPSKAPGAKIPRLVFRTAVFLVMVVEAASTWMPSRALVLTKFFSKDDQNVHRDHRDRSWLMRGDAAENPVARRFDFDDGLVGLDFEQQLALLDGLAVLLLPGDEFPRFLSHFERGHHDADCHIKKVEKWKVGSGKVK